MATAGAAIREALGFVGYLYVVGPIGYAVFGAVGGVAYGTFGDLMGWHADLYEWIGDCMTAGGVCGWVGVLACAAWWVRWRRDEGRREDRLSSLGRQLESLGERSRGPSGRPGPVLAVVDDDRRPDGGDEAFLQGRA